MENDSKYIFMLIGKTGSGKSATGNSILGDKLFVSSDKSVSVTKDISIKTVTRNSFTVTAIDAPGVMDTKVGFENAKSKSCSEMTAAMNQCPRDGKLAIVLVLKYGDRFTEENRLTIYILKNIFGDDNLWRSCIVVLTHGDLFKINNEEDVTFESWLRDQEDELGELFKDCSYRCVLFNNRTKRPEESDKQFLELVKLTEELDQEYTMAKFEEAKKRQNRLMLEEKLPEIIKDYNEKMKTIITTSRSLYSKDKTYNKVVSSIDGLFEELKKLDSPDEIYYNKEEPLFLNEQRDELIIFKNDIDVNVTLKELVRQADKLGDPATPSVPHWRENVSRLEWSIYQISGKVNSNTALRGYNDMVDSLQNKLESFKFFIECSDFRTQCERKINNLRSQVMATPIPSELTTFTNFFVEAEKLFSEIVERQNEYGQMSIHLMEIDNIKDLIRYKQEDSSVTSGWNRTAWMMGAVSLRTAFIPGVGIPLSIGLNVVPFVGKTVHRQYLKFKNMSHQEL